MNVRRPWRLQSPEEKFFKREISAQIQCDPRKIDLINIKEFLQGHRFLYFRTQNGFGKLASDEAGKQQLAKEEQRTRWAREMTLPTANILQQYQETPQGYGFFVLEKLIPHHDSFIKNIADLAHCPAHLSRRYARLSVDTVLKSSYLPVKVFDAEHFSSNETAQSPEIMLLHVNKWLELFENPETQETIVQVFPSLEALLPTLNASFSELPKLISSLVNSWGVSETPYFVHNDASIKNMYFRRKGWHIEEAFLIDFEHSTATHYPILGMLKDLADLCGATGYNPALQQELVKEMYTHTFVHLPYLGTTDQMYQLVRAVLLYSTLNFCQSVLFRAAEHTNSASTLANDSQRDLVGHLLSQLPSNIQFLEELSTSEQTVSTALSPSY